MAKKSINPPIKNNSRIPNKALEKKTGVTIGYPFFSFAHVCDRHCLLSEWKGSELLELIDTFRKMEAIPWSQIHNHSGLRFKKVEGFTKPLPGIISPEVTVYEVRVCQRKRVFGYRIDDLFRLIWFDREHEVFPFRKQKRA